MAHVLLLPFLQIPSGHHLVADATCEWLSKQYPQIQTEKVDVLSHFNPYLEKMVSALYLKWIHLNPKSYHWIYQKMADDVSSSQKHRKLGYRLLFLKRMKKIIQDANPKVVICTHAFPSNLLNELKGKRLIQTPIVNIYTDYYIHHLWGLENIDLHFVPDARFREVLLGRGVDSHRIIVTGIPISPIFSVSKKLREKDERREKIRLLVSGGNIGLGLDRLIQEMMQSKSIQYFVLCGKNKSLYDRLKDLHISHITPLPYISSREEMNRLYEEMDGIITKPGGATISECLQKGLPIFIHSALPGQESYNLSFLQDRNLAILLSQNETLESQVAHCLNNPGMNLEMTKRMEEYRKHLQWESALDRLGKWLQDANIKSEE